MDTCERPAEGWSGPDERGHLKYTMHGRVSESAPEREGWDPFFVAVHGSNFTTWTYQPVEDTPFEDLSDEDKRHAADGWLNFPDM